MRPVLHVLAGCLLLAQNGPALSFMVQNGPRSAPRHARGARQVTMMEPIGFIETDSDKRLSKVVDAKRQFGDSSAKRSAWDTVKAAAYGVADAVTGADPTGEAADRVSISGGGIMGNPVVKVVGSVFGALKGAVYSIADAPGAVESRTISIEEARAMAEAERLSKLGAKQSAARERRASLDDIKNGFFDAVEAVESAADAVVSAPAAIGKAATDTVAAAQSTAEAIAAAPANVQRTVADAVQRTNDTVQSVVYAPLRAADSARRTAVQAENLATSVSWQVSRLQGKTKAGEKGPALKAMPQRLAPLTRAEEEKKAEEEKAKAAPKGPMDALLATLGTSGAVVRVVGSVVVNAVLAPKRAFDAVAGALARGEKSRQRVREALEKQEVLKKEATAALQKKKTDLRRQQEVAGLPEAAGGKEAPKAEAAADTKVEPKVESKVDTKVDAKVETKVDAKVETKVEAKVDTKVETKVETKAEAKVDTKDTKAEAKEETKVEASAAPAPAKGVKASKEDRKAKKSAKGKGKKKKAEDKSKAPAGEVNGESKAGAAAEGEDAASLQLAELDEKGDMVAKAEPEKEKEDAEKAPGARKMPLDGAEAISAAAAAAKED